MFVLFCDHLHWGGKTPAVAIQRQDFNQRKMPGHLLDERTDIELILKANFSVIHQNFLIEAK